MRQRTPSGRIACVVAALAIQSLPVSVRADQVTGSGVPAVQANIRDFKDGKIVYYLPQGDERVKEYEKIDQLSVEGENAFNDAENSFSQGQKDQSVDNYIKAIHDTTKPWVKLFSARRIHDAVGDAGRFDARLTAYLAVLSISPDDAAKQKPQLPDAGSKYLDSAVAEIESTLKTPGLGDAPQLALLNFLIDIQRKRGDDASVASTLERISKTSGGKSTDPAVLTQLSALKVTQAQVALQGKEYKKAINIINDVRPMLNEPKSQSDALMVLAQCALAMADKTDKSALQDAGLAFMRVVAHFSDVDGKPNVLPALQQTASILEQTGDKHGAIDLLGQIAKEFPDDPAATQAQQDIERLKKG